MLISYSLNEELEQAATGYTSTVRVEFFNLKAISGNKEQKLHKGCKWTHSPF